MYEDPIDFLPEVEAAAIRRIRAALEGESDDTRMGALTWMIEHELSDDAKECALAILARPFPF
jgi:hypothetical protein